MNKREGVLMGVIAVVAVVLVVALVIPKLQGGGGGGRRIIVGTTTSTTTAATSTIYTVVPTTTVQGFQGCLSALPTVPVPEGNFAAGTFLGWNVTGVGFGTGPLNITLQNSNSVLGSQPNSNYTNRNPWKGYTGTYFASTYQGGLSIEPGNLTSQAFQVTEPYLSFQIVSPQSDNIYVEILRNNVTVIRSFYDTFDIYGAHNFTNESINLAPFMCSNVRIRVVADVVGSPGTRYDYMAIGNFYLSRSSTGTRGLINQSMNVS
ncbi:MAG: hypothetical protein M1321_02005 [Candidatus Marsarchaeota archaeon]|jgi:hypothetical protein|nr:hypothetical protein [Candidatus Marsarchaeota archaeon]